MSEKSFKMLWVAIPIVAVLTITGNVAYVYGTQDTIEATVTGKERVVRVSDGTSVSKYLVFTQGETFENRDSLLLLKFNSSDVQGHLVDGGRYTLKVYGWRIPFLSQYRNIIEVE